MFTSPLAANPYYWFHFLLVVIE
ncbi:putative membrane protein, partial [Vibrio parahaemolyticus EKP-028]